MQRGSSTHLAGPGFLGAAGLVATRTLLTSAPVLKALADTETEAAKARITKALFANMIFLGSGVQCEMTMYVRRMIDVISTSLPEDPIVEGI
jgi:hypothetical protein